MNIVAQNPTFNTSINEGHRLVGLMQAGGFSDARLYANEVSGMPARMVPETPDQDNSDLPSWAAETDGDLSGTDPNLPIYLDVYTSKTGNFSNVAQVLRLVDAGVPLATALN